MTFIKNNSDINYEKDAKAKEIERSIKELKERDVFPEPKKNYQNIIRDKSENTKEKRKKNIFSQVNIWIVIIAVLSIVLVTTAAVKTIIKIGDVTKYTKPEPIVQDEYIEIHDIEFGIADKVYEENSLKLDLMVNNSSKNNLYTTIRSIYLIDKDGNKYFPNIEESDIPVNLFGKVIVPNTEEKAMLVFNDTDESKEYSLIIKNVSDTQHFIWDYVITLSKD